jgi:hypothetical protein
MHRSTHDVRIEMGKEPDAAPARVGAYWRQLIQRRTNRQEVEMAASAPTLAGLTSTVLFVASYLPMLVRAYRTRDLHSYSLGNLVIATVGNAVYAVYVVSLPIGPIWFLHGFYTLSTGLMLVWFFCYRTPAAKPRPTVDTSARAGVAP